MCSGKFTQVLMKAIGLLSILLASCVLKPSLHYCIIFNRIDVAPRSRTDVWNDFVHFTSGSYTKSVPITAYARTEATRPSQATLLSSMAFEKFKEKRKFSGSTHLEGKAA